jgi:hypothetical protein
VAPSAAGLWALVLRAAVRLAQRGLVWASREQASVQALVQALVQRVRVQKVRLAVV